MGRYNAFKDDLKKLDISEDQELTKRYVTGKYKKMAKILHPDKVGGTNEDFQELQLSYCRLIDYI